MRRLLPCLFLLFSLTLQAEDRHTRPLIGGEDTTTDYPWMAALLRARYSDPYVAQFCGATLIAARWALTAAHCVSDPALGDIDLWVGSADLKRASGLRYRVTEIIAHPDFVPPESETGLEFDSDIALLRLESAVSGIRPVDLPGPEFDVLPVKPGTPATLLGWGAMDFDNQAQRAENFPTRLKQVSVPVVPALDCLRVMGEEEVSGNMFCAGTVDLGGDSCIGDSGGPLAVPATTVSGWLQAGIISWGLGCAYPGFYGVYTRVGKYAQWITEQICQPAERPPRPVLRELHAEGGRVSLSWYSAGIGVRYRVYYRVSMEGAPIRYLEAGAGTTFSAAAPPGISFDVAVQSYFGACNGKFSTIQSFTVE